MNEDTFNIEVRVTQRCPRGSERFGSLLRRTCASLLLLTAAGFLAAVGDAADAPNTGPAAAFSYSMKDMTVAVDVSSSRRADTRYAWDFGDGTTADGDTASHTYERPGTYTVKMTGTERTGEVFSASRVVTPRPANRGPTARFQHAASGLRISVDASSSSDPEGPIDEYAWDFGDGNTGAGVKASHTYAEPGTYRVTLTVSDYLGASDSMAPRITVSESTGGD